MVKHTYLHDKHVKLGAKMVDFAGWHMPVQYSSIIEEHKTVRENVGLFDEFWERVKSKYEIIGVRDSKYIVWRYIHMPLRNYEIAMATENGKPMGYIIGRITNVADMSCGMIVDFLVEENREEIAAALLKYMEQRFFSQKAGLVGCLMQRHFEEAHSLTKAGFFICPKRLEPQPFPVIYRTLQETNDKNPAPDFHQWFFTMGDYDVI